MKGYKAFNNNLTCRDYQFTIDGTRTFDSEPILCMQGFHFCTDLQDIVNYYRHCDMRVFEIEATGIITEADANCSKRACSEIKLVKEISLEEVALCITKSELVYLWARDIGNRDIMINQIKDSENAYRWAKWIGNRDIMINHITKSQNAYMWARFIGNIDIMKSKVTDSWWINIWNNTFLDDRII